MSDNVYVADGDSQSETATLLLAAAEETGHDQSVVQRYTGQHSGWQVPEEVANKAGLDTFDPYEDLNAEVEQARKDGGTASSDDRDLLLPKGAELDDAGVPIQARDEEAARAAVGNIDSGPEQGAQEADKADLSAEQPADVAQAQKTATKTTAKKTTAKKTASKTTAKKTATTSKEK